MDASAPKKRRYQQQKKKTKTTTKMTTKYTHTGVRMLKITLDISRWKTEYLKHRDKSKREDTVKKNT